MPSAKFPTDRLTAAAQRMHDFEATASRAGTATGSRRDGATFEAVVRSWFSETVAYLEKQDGVRRSDLRDRYGRAWVRLTKDDRAFMLQTSNASTDLPAMRKEDERWLETTYPVSYLVHHYPGTEAAIEKYAPNTGSYADEQYPSMFAGLKTAFDDTIVLEQAGVLKEKVLLEYKSAKSTGGDRIDGNAHERLTFQIMQYLEVATLYARCSLTVITNGAFSKYKNKYHVNFHVQADRLQAFKWFKMQHLSTSAEYRNWWQQIVEWFLHARELD